MTFDIVKLHFSSPLHIARGKPGDESGDEILHSDALKSAIFASAMQVGLEPDAGQDASAVTCPFLDAFTLSSAFPFVGGEYFFPKPQSGLPDIKTSNTDFNQHKEKKKIRYVGKSLFEKIIARNEDKIPETAFCFNKKYISEERIDAEYVMMEDMTMRVAVPRNYAAADVDARPYYTGRVHFYDKAESSKYGVSAEENVRAGLYFFIHCDEKSLLQKIKTALEVLGENGIGTDRTTGNGCFTAEWSTMDLKTPEMATHRILLSLYCPEKTEIAHLNYAETPSAAYNLVKRGGWISSAENEGEYLSFRKRSIYMFDEGSVLPVGEQDYRGVLHDLKPEILGEVAHPIWRDGRAFSLPINLIPT